VSRPKVKVKEMPAQQSAKLLDWYDRHPRILPWRALPGIRPDPYHVWVSEIMLQQTTKAAVGPYYQKFIRRWPTVHALAKAPLDHVLQMWAGLGYYRRAHLLHDCAKVIVANYGGRFPDTEDELLRLPGCGPYTAAAVGAIAFNQRTNVVDGNVERVMARLFCIRTPLPRAKAEIRAAAATLVPAMRNGDYAQALMDLGSTLCTPRLPKCSVCPWNKNCQALAAGIEEQLPPKIKRAAKPVRHAVAFILFNAKGDILIRKRPPRGLLGGMMEIPSSEWLETPLPNMATIEGQAPLATRWTLLPGRVKHVFSHFDLDLSVATGTATKRISSGNHKWIAVGGVSQEALPTVMLKIVRHMVKHI
jgi:A/G-specific adenine glycosylase